MGSQVKDRLRCVLKQYTGHVAKRPGRLHISTDRGRIATAIYQQEAYKEKKYFIEIW
jgi:hypothetical protein